ncbi:MAG TPA: STAS domain-containing protein [Acidimicrobiales bacterium]
MARFPCQEPSYQVSVESVDGECVIVFGGDLDLAASGELWACVEKIRDGGRPVVIDLSGTRFMDSAGVNLLLRAYRAHGQVPEAVVLRSPSEAVRSVLEMTSVTHLFRIEDGAAPA